MISGGLHWEPIPARLLDLDATLTSGQSFRWRRRGGEWCGVIADSVFRVRAEEEGFWWESYPVSGNRDLLWDYFALDVDLPRLQAAWVAADPESTSAVRKYSGLRILRQEPEVAFFSFLCSSCNTITKITRSIQALEKRAGTLICVLEGEYFHRFPNAAAIGEIPEAELRRDLWGYRAPRLIELARLIAARGPQWLPSLRNLPYREAHAALAGLFGIGAKLADCICLFGLGHDEAVPVDTHIRQIGVERFRPDLKTRSLTPSVYWTLGDTFRERFGDHAGWAQQVLFMEHLTR